MHYNYSTLQYSQYCVVGKIDYMKFELVVCFLFYNKQVTYYVQCTDLDKLGSHQTVTRKYRMLTIQTLHCFCVCKTSGLNKHKTLKNIRGMNDLGKAHIKKYLCCRPK